MLSPQLHDLLVTVVQIATTAAVGAFTTFLVQLARKAGVDLSQAKQDQLQATVSDGIHFAEETLASRANTLSSEVLNSAKMSAAVSYVLTKLPSADVSTVQNEIHSILPQVGLGATAPKAGV